MRRLGKYLITMTVGALLVFWIAYTKDVFSQTEPGVVFHILCDAFFVAGTLITAAGLLIFTTNEGAFDMLSYGVKAFVDLFRRDKLRKYDTYYDYRTARASKKFPFAFLLICGVVFLAVAFVMYYFYSQYG